MKVKLLLLLLVIVFVIIGCSDDKVEQEFNFEGEADDWFVTISGELSTGDIYEEADATFTYQGGEDIKSVVISIHTNGNRPMITKDVDKLSNNDSVEIPFENYGFWDFYDTGLDIFINFEWRKGERNTKKEDTITLTLVE